MESFRKQNRGADTNNSRPLSITSPRHSSFLSAPSTRSSTSASTYPSLRPPTWQFLRTPPSSSCSFSAPPPPSSRSLSSLTSPAPRTRASGPQTPTARRVAPLLPLPHLRNNLVSTASRPCSSSLGSRRALGRRHRGGLRSSRAYTIPRSSSSSSHLEQRRPSSSLRRALRRCNSLCLNKGMRRTRLSSRPAQSERRARHRGSPLPRCPKEGSMMLNLN